MPLLVPELPEGNKLFGALARFGDAKERAALHTPCETPGRNELVRRGREPGKARI